MLVVGANLDYGEVHRSVKNFNLKLFKAKVDMTNMMKKNWKKIIPQVQILERSSFLSKDLKLLKKLDLWRELP